MGWQKASASLVAAFEAAFPDDPRAERRTMFGFPCGFVRGNMFAGLYQEHVVVRLPADERAELLAQTGATPFVARGRTMREYALLPVSWHANPGQLSFWLQRAFDYASALPPKQLKRGRAADRRSEPPRRPAARTEPPASSP